MGKGGTSGEGRSIERLSRRAVLAAGAAAAAVPPAIPAAVSAIPAEVRSPARKAVIASTWDFGAAANRAAFARLTAGGSLIDAIEEGAKVPEADPSNHSVGRGGYPDRDGRVTLDAIIMDDVGNVGAVAALEDVVHAISVARAVMERTPHTMLVGTGAGGFARAQGFSIETLLTPEAAKAWREWLETARYAPVANRETAGPARSPVGTAADHDTIGIIARDPNGRFAGGCTTSGMAFKMHGRVGDSPLAGCGLFVERGVGAATATGVGEEVVRIAGSARVVASMRGGMTPAQACREAVTHLTRLRGRAIAGVQVGLLAIGRDGDVGACALLPGFTYAVTDTAGNTEVRAAPSLTA